MARQRDYAAEYAARSARARESGFSSYGQERQALAFADKSRDFAYYVGEAGGKNRSNLDMVKLYYQAFKTGPKDDYTIHTRRGKVVVLPDGRGAKAKWLIDVAGYVDDADDWKRRYPRGTRE